MLPTTVLAVAAVGAGGAWSRPVHGPVFRSFDAPETRFGPGHLGVDFGATSGTPVRAAGDGVVVFAGTIGNERHVVVRHSSDLRTSYSFLAEVDVLAGQPVERGAVLGTSGGTGPRHDGLVLHFGVRVGANYVDPMLLFTAVDLGAVVHLAAPHGGPAGPPPPVAAAPGSVGERSAIVAALRVDARSVAPPPSWWIGAQHPAATERRGRASPPAPAVAAAARPPAGRSAPVTALVGATVVSAGAVTVARRRRRDRGR